MTTESPGRFSAHGLPVLIGSVPLTSHHEALEWIFTATPEIPLWPQLPSHPLERMMPQFSENIPCIREENLGSDDSRIRYDTSGADFEAEMLAFYEEYLAASEDLSLLDSSRFQASRERAAGLYLFAEQLDRADIKAVKGQVTGPFTMLTGIKDTEGRPGYFNETVRDMVIKAISMKAAWQVRFLGQQSGKPVLLFIDEPALAGLGSSAFISIGGEDIREMISEVAGAIQRAGGLAGIHVCANTDWSLLLNSSIDILSFDAFGYFDRLAPLGNELASFLDRDGILAWGLVPTSRAEDIEQASTDGLAALWQEQAATLAGPDRDLAALLRQTLITPSCGTGSLKPELARRVLSLTSSLAEELRTSFLN